ncbi:MAG: 2-amino-4-hydroxy-6-hydroxymethyldihydropteridine diphosphokinase [Alphaproteobacteria bacterium]|nr:2-amino-4-hydroxy-6-hydroxymethyldihydropteridine diphosphokinase [Alphaproteobacteria bacterium]
MRRVALGLGASLGDRRATLERTVQQLAAGPRIEVVRTSRWVRSPPMRGGTAQGWFLNGVVLVRTDLEPLDLLEHCIALERAAGRRRARYWGDRPLDVDILLVEDWSSTDPRLTVPHPGLPRRPFAYWPLREVWPEAAAQLPGPPPPRHGAVLCGVFARDGRAAYQAVPHRPEQPREALHRLREPGPHPRDPRLGSAGRGHDESLPHREGGG